MRILSRRTSKRLVHCEDCGWLGEMRECPPDYNYHAGVNPESRCFKCGSADLWWADRNTFPGDTGND